MSQRRQPEPWEPDPKWHPARVEAFVAYRDTPGATIRGIARALGKSATLIGKWSSEDGWPERRRAWEVERDEVRLEEFKLGEREASQAQGATAAKYRMALDSIAQAFLDKLEAIRATGSDPFDGMTVAEIGRMLGPASRALQNVQQVERLAHGLSTENVGGYDGGRVVGQDVANKSPAQIEAYLTGRADATHECGGDEAAR